MVAVYSIALVGALLALITTVLGAALAESLDRPAIDVVGKLGAGGKTLIGAVAGFGMGGMAAEFSPLDLGWQIVLFVAVAAAGAGALWVRFSTTRKHQQ